MFEPKTVDTAILVIFIGTAVSAGATLVMPWASGRMRRTKSANQHEQPNPSRKQISTILIVAFLACTIPGLTQVALTKRRANAVADVASTAQAAALVSYALIYLTLLCCALAIVRKNSSLEVGEHSQIALWACLAPWALAIAHTMYETGVPPIHAAAYPAVVLALYAFSATITDLRILAPMIGLVAAGSITLGLVAPAKGLMAGARGALTDAEKANFGSTLLAGFYNHPNVLGVILALGAPAVLLTQSSRVRWTLIGIVGVAVLWSGSRTALAATLAAFAAVFIAKLLSSPLRGKWAAVALMAAAATMVTIPLMTTDANALSSRGRIWIGSLAAWRENPVFGNGQAWYSEISKVRNDLIDIAFHGHNMLVNSLATGGLLTAFTVGILLLVASRSAACWARKGQFYPLAYMVAFFVTGATEVATKFRDIDPIFWVAVIPLVVVAINQPKGSERSHTTVPAASFQPEPSDQTGLPKVVS